MYAHFIEEFKDTYIASLLHRSKWLLKRHPYKVGEIVLVYKENTKKFKYPLGEVVEVLTSQDGISRTYKIRMAATGKIVQKTHNHIARLEIALEELKLDDREQRVSNEVEAARVILDKKKITINEDPKEETKEEVSNLRRSERIKKRKEQKK